MVDTKKSLVQRLGPEAVVTAVIASVAVLVTVTTFRQHTIDFEEIAQRDIYRLESRIANVEERERSYAMILTRVDTHVNALRDDIASLRGQVATILVRLPSKTD